jgi:hypothetical protein
MPKMTINYNVEEFNQLMEGGHPPILIERETKEASGPAWLYVLLL